MAWTSKWGPISVPAYPINPLLLVDAFIRTDQIPMHLKSEIKQVTADKVKVIFISLIILIEVEN
jgi:hypothetical protein